MLRLDDEKIIYEGGISSYSCTGFGLMKTFLVIPLPSFDYFTEYFRGKIYEKP